MAGELMRARYAFKGEQTSELSFAKGALVRLLARDESGWAQGELEDGAKGWFPADFVVTPAEYDAIEARRTVRKAKKRPSHQKTPSPTESPRTEQPATTEVASAPALEPKPLPVPSMPAPKPTPQSPQPQQQQQPSPKPLPEPSMPAPKPVPQPQPQQQQQQQQPALPPKPARPATDTPPAAAALTHSVSEVAPPRPLQPKPAATSQRQLQPISVPVSASQLPPKPTAAATAAPQSGSVLLAPLPTASKAGPQSGGISELFVSNEERLALWRMLSGEDARRPEVGASDARGPAELKDDVESFQPTSHVSIIRDYMEQLEVLLVRAQCDAAGRPFTLPQGTTVSLRKFEKVAAMPADAVHSKLQVLRNVVVQYSTLGGTLVFVMESLSKIAEHFQDQAPPNVKPPSSKDLFVDAVEATPAPTNDRSPQIFLLGVQQRVLEVNTKNPRTASEIGMLPARVRETLFAFLAFHYKPTIRAAAGECLGLISAQQLDGVSGMFTAKLAHCRGSDLEARELATFQLASAHLRFGLAEHGQLEPTCNFFSAVAVAAEKTSRAVLRVAMCKSLTAIIDGTLLGPKAAAGRCQEFEDKHAAKFWNCFLRLFESAKKWTKSDKTKVEAVRLMTSMLLSDTKILLTKADDFLAVVLPDVRDQKLHSAYVKVLSRLVQQMFGGDVPPEHALFFHGTCGAILGKVLLTRVEAKRVNPFPPAGVLKDVYELLLAAGRKGVRIPDQKTIISVISMQDHPNEYKGVILRAMAQLYSELGEAQAFADNIERVQEMLSSFFRELHSEASPTRTVLLCFPALCRAADRQRTFEKAVRFLGEGDSDLNSMAMTAVINYVKSDPDNSLLIAVRLLLFHIFSVVDTQTAEDVLRYVSPLCKLLDVWQLHMTSTGAQSTIQSQLWAELREQLEGLFLVLVLYNEPVVWTKALFLGDVMRKPAFRAIEANSDHAFIIEAFENADTSAQGWAAHLTRFLQNYDRHAAALQWAFTRLHQHWSTRVQHWKTVLRFLLLSVRIAEPSGPAADFLRGMVSRYFSAPSTDDVSFVFTDTLPEMHDSCCEVIVASVETEHDKQMFESKQKKKQAPFYHQENVITIYARVLLSITPAAYLRSEVLRKAFRQVIEYWIEAHAALESFHPAFKICVASIFERFHFLEGTLEEARLSAGEAEEAEEKAGPASTIRDPAFGRRVFDVLFRLLNTRSGSSRSSTYEVSIMKALSVLVRYNEVDSNFLSTSALPMLCSCLRYGPHMEEEVASALGNALRRIPDLLGSFMERSMKLDTVHRQEAALFHMAVLNNFTAAFDKWVALCPIPQMACYTIVHLATNPSKDALSATIDFANFLVSGKPADISPAYRGRHKLFACKTRAEYPEHSQLYIARTFSDTLAERAAEDTGVVLEWMDNWIDSFSEQNMRGLLSIVSRWAANINKAASADPTPLLQSLLSISCKCNVACLQDVLETSWQQTVSIPQHAARVVDFLVDSATAAEESRNAKVRDVCSRAILYISRTPALDAVLQRLTERMRNYKSQSSDPRQFVQQLLLAPQAAKEDDVQHEKTAFILATPLVFEHHEHIGPFLPLLFQNAAVLYCSLRKQEDRLSEADDVVNNSLLGFLANSDLEEEVEKKARALVAKKVKWNADDLVSMVDLMAAKYPKLRACWAEIALDWGLGLADDESAADSLHIFALLNKTFDEALVLKLLACLAKFTFCGQYTQRNTTIDILLTVPSETLAANSRAWLGVVRAAGSMLLTASVTQYTLACNLLRAAMGSCGSDVAQRLSEALQPLWPEPLGACAVLLRGISSQSSHTAALWLCETLAAAPKQPGRGAMLVLASLVHALMIFSKSPEAAVRAHRFAGSCGAQQLAPIADAFSHMDMRNVPVNQQPDVTELLSSFFSAFFEAFPTREDFLLVTDFVLVLLRKGMKRWRPALLEAAARLLVPTIRGQAAAPAELFPSAAQLLQLAELVVFYSQSSDSAVSSAAIVALSGVLRSIPEGTSMRFFDNLRVLQSELYPGATGMDVFVGMGEEDEHSLTLESCKKMLELVFEAPQVAQQLTPQLMESAKSKLASPTAAAAAAAAAADGSAGAVMRKPSKQTLRRPYDAIQRALGPDPAAQ